MRKHVLFVSVSLYHIVKKHFGGGVGGEGEEVGFTCVVEVLTEELFEGVWAGVTLIALDSDCALVEMIGPAVTILEAVKLTVREAVTLTLEEMSVEEGWTVADVLTDAETGLKARTAMQNAGYLE